MKSIFKKWKEAELAAKILEITNLINIYKNEKDINKKNELLDELNIAIREYNELLK